MVGQAICKLSFIDESRLLSEIANVEHTLTVMLEIHVTCNLVLVVSVGANAAAMERVVTVFRVIFSFGNLRTFYVWGHRSTTD